MSERGKVDLDRLADYVGGALDGTSDETAVADLIASEPAWARAHAELTEAWAAVDADLRAYAARPEPVPDDVAARLDRALAPVAGPANARRTRGRLTVVPTEPGRPTAARRRWPAWATPVGVAAALLVCAGFSLTWLNDQTGTTDQSSAGGAAAENAPAMADSGRPAATATAFRVLRTDTNYTPETNWNAAAKGAPPLLTEDGADSNRSTAQSAVPYASQGPDDAVGPLARLDDPAALQTCFDAIALAGGLGPITVTQVDYARFEGAPALMVRFTDPGGQQWALAAGPQCGVAGADERYRTRVT